MRQQTSLSFSAVLFPLNKKRPHGDVRLHHTTSTPVSTTRTRAMVEWEVRTLSLAVRCRTIHVCRSLSRTWRQTSSTRKKNTLHIPCTTSRGIMISPWDLPKIGPKRGGRLRVDVEDYYVNVEGENLC
jgi:hypothetical protein